MLNPCLFKRVKKIFTRTIFKCLKYFDNNMLILKMLLVDETEKYTTYYK